MSLTDHWQRRDAVSIGLRPVSLLFSGLVRLRRSAYRRGLLTSHRLGVPVVVVGNITVGGTGKTPLIVALAAELERRGYRPGVVSRGYGARIEGEPRVVRPDSDPRSVGDEPLLIRRRAGVPVVVHPDRVAAGRKLLAVADCDVILSDDGLQHYRLARDFEIAVVDGSRGTGNHWCLPAGPLREPRGRLRSVDAVVVNGPGEEKIPGAWPMELAASRAVNLVTGASRPLSAFAGQAVHAVAGIGHPARFARTLEQGGIHPRLHPFPDHHRFAESDFAFGADLPVLMTEKDAVKCGTFAREEWWYVPVEATVSPGLTDIICQRLEASHG